MAPLIMIEGPITCYLAKLENTGILFNVQVAYKLVEPIEYRIQQLERDATKSVNGQPFNLNSPKDVSDMLYSKLKFAVPHNAKKHQNGRYSTKAEVLKELEAQNLHELPTILLEHRKLTKNISYVHEFINIAQQIQQKYLLARSLNKEDIEKVKRRQINEQGEQLIRMRCIYCQCSASTGRLATEDPCLQTVPNTIDYKTVFDKQKDLIMKEGASKQQQGYDLSQEFSEYNKEIQINKGISEGQVIIQQANIRQAFQAPQGYILVAADYCQMELRLMAHFSQDQDLCDLFRNNNSDPFLSLAAKWLKKNTRQVSKEDRQKAKAIAYGLIYGKGIQALANDMKCSLQEAALLKEGFEKCIPGVMDWKQRIIQECIEKKHVTTLSLRKRHLPHIRDKVSSKRAEGERQAINTVCQGSASDLVKICMLKLDDYFGQHVNQDICQLVLMLHDELIFEVKQSNLDQTLLKIKEIMESAITLSIPFPIKLKVGPNWGELQEWKV